MAKRKPTLTQEQLQQGAFEGKTHLVVELTETVQYLGLNPIPAGQRAVVVGFGRVESNKGQVYVHFPKGTVNEDPINGEDFTGRVLSKGQYKPVGRIDMLT